MFYNYFKIAWRNLLKNKLFSLINICGLGLALPFALLALMQIQSTYESDNFHPFSDRTYRIISVVTPATGSTLKYASTPFQLAHKLKADYPITEKSTSVIRQFGWELTNQIKTIQVNSIFVEPAFFEMFGFRLASGTVPLEPNTLVMTSEMASTFFGDSDPIGQTVTHPLYGDLTVTGVLQPYKRNTHFRSDVLVSMSTVANPNNNQPALQSWTAFEEAFTYVVLDAHTSIAELRSTLKTLANQLYEGSAAGTDRISFDLQSINDISPDTQDLRNNPYVEDWADLSINFLFAAILILLAGFNYTNLTLARSLSRAKEVGIRKVSGALRGQLLIQFTFEAVLISGFSLVLAYFIFNWMKVFIHVPWFAWEVDRPWILGVMVVAFTLMIGVLAGVMPAWFLSGLQPVSVLKGTLNPISFGKVGFRKSLVVIQFVVTTCFIFMIGHMYHQFEFMATDNVNFNRKDILNISLPDNNYKNLVQDFRSHPGVINLGLTSSPFGHNGITAGIKNDKLVDNLATYYYAADADFVDNMKLKLLSGDNLLHLQSDSADSRVLINEQAALALGLGTPKEAIGKSFYLNNGEEPLHVQGVLKNFCYSNYQFDLQPVVIQYNPSLFKVLSLKIESSVNKDALIADMRQTWKTFHPYEDLSYSWYEKELFDRYYPGADMRFLGMICGIILIIAVMGLLGMVIYTTEKRIREIGIRKVIGATVLAIVKELSWSFVKLILIAILIAIPIGYMSGRIFLSVFTFHDSISWTLMSAIVSGIVIIGLSTIVVFAARAANNNPVKSLRME